MTAPPRSLNIFYRHVHIKADQRSRDPNKARPPWFSHENCFRNLLKTILRDPQGTRVRLNLMYDGTLDDLNQDFIAKYCAKPDVALKIHVFQGGSDRASSLVTLDLARRQELGPDDLVYLLENDYLHQDGWVSRVFEAFDSPMQFSYLSLYDHADKYFYKMYEDLSARLMHTAHQHWRTAPSSCASYLLTRRTLEADYDVLSQGIPDYYFFSQLATERQRVLLTPVPGLSTHCMSGYLSPVVDWARVAHEADQP